MEGKAGGRAEGVTVSTKRALKAGRAEDAVESGAKGIAVGMPKPKAGGMVKLKAEGGDGDGLNSVERLWR